MSVEFEAYFRVDASPQIGAGHFVRCLCLASTLSDLGGEITFLSSALTSSFVDELNGLGFGYVDFSNGRQVLEGNVDLDSDREKIREFISSRACSIGKILIVDHYGIDRDWHKVVKKNVDSLLVIDDLNNRYYECDFLLDQTFGKNESVYAPWLNPAAKALVGSHYSLIRREFQQRREQSLAAKDKQGDLRRILISLGAADIDNLSSKVIQALDSLDIMSGVEIDVVLGAVCPHAEAIQNQLNELHNIQGRLHIATSEMANLLCLSDLCISAAGSTLWECCVLGVPTLAYITANNQKMIADELSKEGAIKFGGELRNLSLEAIAMQVSALSDDLNGRLKLSKISRNVCDGGGAERVADLLVTEMKKEPVVA